jgi:uncharacterized surface protein with fasciclin (FAS1) repeats
MYVMKKTFNFFIILSLVLLASSCEKDNDSATTLPTAESILQGDTDMSIFYSMIKKAQLEGFLNGPGPFTWMVPENAACTKAGVTADSVSRMTAGTANYYVMYHLFNAKVFSIEISALQSTNRNTQGGQALWLSTDRTNYFVNGERIIKTDMEAQNGIVHKVSGFFIPPPLRGNIQSLLTATGQHATLIAALQKTGLWTSLGSTSVFTILAPNDAAFAKAGITIDMINALTGAALTSFTNRMRYHLFNVRLFSSDFRDGRTPGTVLGSTRTIGVSNGGKLLTSTSTPAVTAAFVTTNSLGTNGVMNVIDNVLNP